MNLILYLQEYLVNRQQWLDGKTDVSLSVKL